MKCRYCTAQIRHTFLDLGFAPPSNAYLTAKDLHSPEIYFPLRVLVCDKCWLVQTEDYSQAEELFRSDYAYFSSTSSSWMLHARNYFEHIRKLLDLNSESFVVEIASNDGYLLRNFVSASIPCLGIEPTDSTSDEAEAHGVSVLRDFFCEELGQRLASAGRFADLVIGNNVYAHVPDINNFTRGMATLLKPNGVVTLEFPHLMQLIHQKQFDTIYHEHFSYLSLGVVDRIFNAAGLRIWDVEELPTHGGSLRVYGCQAGAAHVTKECVKDMLQREATAGLNSLTAYTDFQMSADKIKNDLLNWLIKEKSAGRRVSAYGAAAKGNTLLNYAGIKPDLIAYVCDSATAKQGKYLPGSHIPIVSPSVLHDNPPDAILVLPWNISSELIQEIRGPIACSLPCFTAVPYLHQYD